MATKEIREYVMTFEPDKCRLCGSLFSGVTAGQRDPFPDVTVQYDCGSCDWFSTWAGRPEDARETEGVTGLHVGEDYGHLPVYLRKLHQQRGDCYRRENLMLKERVEELAAFLEERQANE